MLDVDATCKKRICAEIGWKVLKRRLTLDAMTPVSMTSYSMIHISMVYYSMVNGRMVASVRLALTRVQFIVYMR